MVLYCVLYCVSFIYFLSSYMPLFCCKLMQLYSVQLIPGKAENTGDKDMYPSASGGLGGPQTPPDFKRLLLTVCVLINTLFYIIDFGISAKFGSCGFILPLRKSIILYDNSLFHYDFFLYFLLL